MVKDSGKVPIVEGFRFRVYNIEMRNELYHPYAGPSTIRVEMEANSYDYTKKDWGELMEALTAGEGVTVVVKNG